MDTEVRHEDVDLYNPFNSEESHWDEVPDISIIEAQRKRIGSFDIEYYLRRKIMGEP